MGFGRDDLRRLEQSRSADEGVADQHLMAEVADHRLRFEAERVRTPSHVAIVVELRELHDELAAVLEQWKRASELPMYGHGPRAPGEDRALHALKVAPAAEAQHLYAL